MVKKSVEQIAGMGKMIHDLHNQGKIPRIIQNELRKHYKLSEIPSLTTLYNYIDRSNIQRVNDVSLTGDVRSDAKMLMHGFDGLLDSIYAKYDIKYKEKKKSELEVSIFRDLLNAFIEECLAEKDDVDRTIEYWYKYLTDEVFLPIVNEVDESIMDRLLKRLEQALENWDSGIKETEKKYLP